MELARLCLAAPLLACHSNAGCCSAYSKPQPAMLWDSEKTSGGEDLTEILSSKRAHNLQGSRLQRCAMIKGYPSG